VHVSRAPSRADRALLARHSSQRRRPARCFPPVLHLDHLASSLAPNFRLTSTIHTRHFHPRRILMSRAGDWAREALAGPGCWVYCSPLSRPVWVPADDSEHRNDCEMVQQASCICAAQRNREQQQDATPEPEPAAEHAHAAELERAAQPAYAAEHAHAASSIKVCMLPLARLSCSHSRSLQLFVR
jgi:hypothetical protein